MRRFARLPSRILAISAATFLGAVGAVAFAAAPAGAHTATVTSDIVCGPKAGTAVVTYKVTNNHDTKTATIKKPNRKVDGLKNAEVAPKASVSASETVDVSEKSITLTFTMDWKGFEENESHTVDLTRLDCAPAKSPTATGTSNCDGTLTVLIKNTSGMAKKFAVNGEGKFVERKVLKADEEWTVVVPKDNAEKARVKWKNADDPGDDGWENEDNPLVIRWVKPDVCFEVTSKSTCEDLTITITNTGAKAIKATVTVGDKSEEETVEPGASAEAVIDGVDGLVAKLSIDGGTAKDYAWAKPADCSGGGLPVTGANAGLLAGAALVLVSGGGGLFFMARRRRVRFAA